MTDILTHAAFVSAVKFDANGLVPAIAQSKETGEVLMFAWMTRGTLEETLATGHVTYWSRSRQKVWRKGETSGNHQRLVEAFVDGLRHFGIGYSWGGFESLIVPAHIKRTAGAFAAEGPVLRIHAGLEDAGDLIADLQRGLARLREHT